MAKKDSIKMLEAKIAVLQQARKEFNTVRCSGICTAIHTSIDWDSPIKFHNAGLSLLEYIKESLEYSLYLEDWLKKNKPHINRSDKNMKEYRLQWIDWMIACLQEDLASKLSKTQA
jgi:hypothetical protein